MKFLLIFTVCGAVLGTSYLNASLDPQTLTSLTAKVSLGSLVTTPRESVFMPYISPLIASEYARNNDSYNKIVVEHTERLLREGVFFETPEGKYGEYTVASYSDSESALKQMAQFFRETVDAELIGVVIAESEQESGHTITTHFITRESFVLIIGRKILQNLTTKELLLLSIQKAEYARAVYRAQKITEVLRFLKTGIIEGLSIAGGAFLLKQTIELIKRSQLTHTRKTIAYGTAAGILGLTALVTFLVKSNVLTESKLAQEFFTTAYGIKYGRCAYEFSSSLSSWLIEQGEFRSNQEEILERMRMKCVYEVAHAGLTVPNRELRKLFRRNTDLLLGKNKTSNQVGIDPLIGVIRKP